MDRRKILREVTTIARLHHQHIVRYYQAWIEGTDDAEDISDDEKEDDDWIQSSRTSNFGSEDDDDISGESERSNECLYIQMEFCPNRTLKDVIDEGVFREPEKIWRLFRQIVESISYIHSKVCFFSLISLY